MLVLLQILPFLCFRFSKALKSKRFSRNVEFIYKSYSTLERDISLNVNKRKKKKKSFGRFYKSFHIFSVILLHRCARRKETYKFFWNGNINQACVKLLLELMGFDSTRNILPIRFSILRVYSIHRCKPLASGILRHESDTCP